MPRRKRDCAAGTWHHAFNRGRDGADIFGSHVDRRTFLALLAREVARGRIEVHAYSLLSNHFHLLLRVTGGGLDLAMRDLCRDYVLAFHRDHGGEGPLFRSRFGSKRVATEDYRRVLLRYIDQNPVEAGLASVPEEYPWGSAWHFSRGIVPAWLCSTWVMQAAGGGVGNGGLLPGAYDSAIRKISDIDIGQLVEARLEASDREDPLAVLPLDSFAAGWIAGRLACGGEVAWAPFVSTRRALAVVADEWPNETRGALAVGLLVDAAGRSVQDVAELLGLSLRATRARLHGYRVALHKDPANCARFERVLERLARGWVA